MQVDNDAKTAMTSTLNGLNFNTPNWNQNNIQIY
jgi:hypothetical protein